MAAVFVDFLKNKRNFLHKNKLSYVGSNSSQGAAPFEEFFSWGSRHHYRTEVGAYGI